MTPPSQKRDLWSLTWSPTRSTVWICENSSVITAVVDQRSHADDSKVSAWRVSQCLQVRVVAFYEFFMGESKGGFHGDDADLMGDFMGIYLYMIGIQCGWWSCDVMYPPDVMWPKVRGLRCYGHSDRPIQGWNWVSATLEHLAWHVRPTKIGKFRVQARGAMIPLFYWFWDVLSDLFSRGIGACWEELGPQRRQPSAENLGDGSWRLDDLTMAAMAEKVNVSLVDFYISSTTTTSLTQSVAQCFQKVVLEKL